MQSQELHVPPSPSECDGQDSGGNFDFKLDGDDDGFIDDFVQEQSKEVHNNDDNLAVDFPHGGSSCPLCQIGIWNVSFCGGRKIRGCGEKPEDVEKNPQSQDKNQQQDARSCNLTQATAVGVEHSYHERPC